jgi:lipase
MRRLAEEELPEMRVIAPDLRGHGHSTWQPPWHAGRHVADLLAALDGAGIDRTTVVGHSFGGLVGLHMAARAPGRVERLALVDPAVALPPALAGAKAEEALRDDGWADVAQARAARLALRPAHARDSVEEDLDTFLERGDDGRVRFRYSRPAVVAAWSEMARPAPSLAGYPGRVLLVEALGADYVTGDLRARLRSDLGARLREVGVDAGHMLFWDAREELGALLRAFVDGAAA